MDWNPHVTSIHDLKISGFVPHTDVRKDGILFSVVVPEGADASLLLYEKGSEEVRCEIPFPEEPALGRVFAMLVSGIPAQEPAAADRTPAMPRVFCVKKLKTKVARRGRLLRKTVL